MYENSSRPIPQQAGVSPKQRTYMEQLMEDLDIQLKRYYDLGSRLYSVASRVKANEPSEAIQKEPSAAEMMPGYLSSLHSKIEQFRKFNNELEETAIKLEQAF